MSHGAAIPTCRGRELEGVRVLVCCDCELETCDAIYVSKPSVTKKKTQVATAYGYNKKNPYPNDNTTIVLYTCRVRLHNDAHFLDPTCCRRNLTLTPPAVEGAQIQQITVNIAPYLQRHRWDQGSSWLCVGRVLPVRMLAVNFVRVSPETVQHPRIAPTHCYPTCAQTDKHMYIICVHSGRHLILQTRVRKSTINLKKTWVQVCI